MSGGVESLLDKFAGHRPTERLLAQWRWRGLDVAAGTVAGGLERLEPLFQPLYDALLLRTAGAALAQADATPWLVFLTTAVPVGLRSSSWLFLAQDPVTFRPPRTHTRRTVGTKAGNGYLEQGGRSGLILPNMKQWLEPSLPNQGLVTQDSAGAQAAFAQAGYTTQGGKLMKGGRQATMSIVMPGNFSDWVAAATEVKNELTAIGINATLELPQYPQYSQAIQGGTFDAAIGGFGGSGDPYTDFDLSLNSSFATPVNKPTANNFQRFKDPSVDQALTTLASATDDTSKLQATYSLEQVMFTKIPIVLMYYGGSWGLFTTKNWTGWPSASNPYTLPTLYNNSLLTVLTHITKA